MRGRKTKTMEERVIAPDPPSWLGAIGKAFWAETVGYLVDNKIFYQLDYHIIEIAAKTYQDWRTAPSPDEAQKAARQFVGIMTKFGATPYARQSIGRKEKPARKTQADADINEEFGFD